MCYEFVHACNSLLTNEIATLIPANKYFLICIGDINYFYSNDATAIASIKTFLKSASIKIYSLAVQEMISVIDFPGMDTYQTFHGSYAILTELRELTGMLAPDKNHI